MPFLPDGTYVEPKPEWTFAVPSLGVVIDLNNENQVAQIVGDIEEELALTSKDDEKRKALIVDKARITKKLRRGVREYAKVDGRKNRQATREGNQQAAEAATQGHPTGEAQS